jgi:uncharacterized membrane protein
MTKREFLDALREQLSALPVREIEEHINFYGEIIDDRIEEGLSEHEAVDRIGEVGEIAAQILAEQATLARGRVNPPKKRRLGALAITLLAVGSPIWLSLGIAALAVVLSLYVTLWSLVVSAWSVFVSFAVTSVACLPVGIGVGVSGYPASGLALVGACLVLGGLAIFVFFGCRAATRGAVWLTRKIVSGIGHAFGRKERV